MANLRTTADIKKAVLQACGEITDGTSPYDSIAMAYINKAYKDLNAGGNIFDITVSEAWTWARARNPILLDLQPAYEVGTVSMTNGSFNGTMSIAPAFSIEGYFLKAEAFPTYYQIKHHVAGSPNFQIDQPWIDVSSGGNFRAFPLEYDLHDDKIIIPNEKTKLDFQENGSTVTAVLTPGVYSISAAVAEVQSKISAVGTGPFTFSFDPYTRLFSIVSTGTVLSLRTVTGPNRTVSAWQLFGFPTTDLIGLLTYSSDNALNAIQRLVAPILTPGPQGIGFPYGKINGIDLLTLQDRYAGNYYNPITPSVFCELFKTENGMVRIRFDSYPTKALRAEVGYIPIAEQLFDNEISVPRMPESYRDYLVNAGSYYLALDKTDDKAVTFKDMAVAKLKAMINDARSNVKLTNNKYGKLIARPGQNTRQYWSTTRGKED